MNKYLDKTGLQDYTNKLTNKYDDRYATKAMVGSPLVAATAADMTNTDKVYVYVGSEAGYVNGDWYYYDGSEWQDGGVYNSAAVVLDDTLTQPDEAAEAKAVGDALKEYAKKDGSYAGLNAGTADNLNSAIKVFDEAAYTSRTTANGNNVGNKFDMRKIIYGSVVHNQLVEHGNFDANTGWSTNRGTLTVSNNKGVFTAPSDVAASSSIYRSLGASARITGHKYLVSVTVKPSVSTVVNFRLFGINVTSASVSADERKTYSAIVSYEGTSTENTVYLYVNNGGGHLSEGDTVEIENFMVSDITTYFGSATIGDAAYTMEQSEAGSGIAWLQYYGFFRKPYYAYNAGTLMSSNPSMHTNVGRNLWNEEWEIGSINNDTGATSPSTTQIRSKDFIRVLPSTVYARTGIDGYVFGYDANKNYIGRISGQPFTTPKNCYYLKFRNSNNYGTTYKNDICIWIHWDIDYDDDPYVAYEEWPYPIDHTVDGRGIFKLDTDDNSIYVDGDELPPDGVFKARYGIVDMGTMIFGYGTSGGVNYFNSSSVSSLAKIPTSADDFTPLLAKGFKTIIPHATGVASLGNMDIFIWTNGTVYFRDDNHTGGDLVNYKAPWLEGVYLIYPLKTPTTTQKEAYTEEQVCDDWGIQYFTDYDEAQGDRDVAIPVGHESVYPVNLRSKLETLPDAPSGVNGKYLMNKTDAGLSYVLQEAEVPALPTTDGTYSLKTTVSGGVASTPEWVAEA